MPRDATRMGLLFSGLGYLTVPLAQNLTAARLRTAWQRWLRDARLGRSDAVVVYYSGHGCVAENDHYLCTTGFDPDRLASTAFKTLELVEQTVRQKARPGKLWLILDCCQSGGVLNEGLYRALGGHETAVFVLAASGGWGQVSDGTFSALLCGVISKAALGPSAPSLDGITGAINDRWSGSRAVQASLSSVRFDFLDRRPSPGVADRER